MGMIKWKVLKTKKNKGRGRFIIEILGLTQTVFAQFIPRVPRQAEENLLVISCEEDIQACQPCLYAGIPVYTAELLLTGILRQELDLQEYPFYPYAF